MTRARLGLAKAAALIALVLAVGLPTIGFPIALFSVALLGGLAVWSLTLLRDPIAPERVIIPYLCTIALFVIHVGEEYLFHIERTLSAVSGFEISQQQFLLLAGFFAPTLWIAGAILFLRRSQIGEYIVSTFYFGMIFGEASHFAFPFQESGRFHYSAGMVTAVPLILSAIYGLKCMFAEARVEHGARGRPLGHD